MNVREVLEFAKKNKVQIVDMKFVDLIGTWQHFTIPISELTEGLFKDGSGLDGSSIRGWKAINNSDMLLVPDPATACLDPFCSVPTLSLVGNVVDPITRETYDRDPRYIAQKAEKYLQSTKIGDTSYWGPEAEFFIFDHARYDQTSHSGYYFIDSDEGVWNMGQEGVQPGRQDPSQGGILSGCRRPIRNRISAREMILEMEKAGIAIEKHHHEVATAGQAEIDIRFDSLVKTADKMMMYKYIVKNVARRHGKTATFMPKPIFGDNGSGHAYAPKHLEGGQAAVRRERICRHLATVSALYRRHPEACSGPGGVHQSDDELLQAADAGVRGAGSAGLFQPESVCRHPDSHVLTEPEGQADRGAFSRPGRKSLPRLFRHAHGGLGRDREQDQSW